MFWSMSEPLDATIELFSTFAVIAVFLVPAFSYLFKCRWWKLAIFAILFGILCFPATCGSICKKIDAGRFGLFRYHEYDDVKDERILRYLPPKASRITLFKTANGAGYVGYYKISEVDLLDFVDNLWEKHGEFSVVTKEDLEASETKIASEPQFEILSSELLVDPRPIKLRCGTPVAGNGAGATYYFDAETEEVYQFSGYW